MRTVLNGRPAEYALFFTALWIAVALVASIFRGIPWLEVGDFGYATAMYYHGIMIPVLVMLYLLVRKAIWAESGKGWIYEVCAIISIALVGIGSFFNVGNHFSLAAAIQVAGMVAVDLMGIVLLLSLVRTARRKGAVSLDVSFWLLFCSLFTILITAPLAHLAGWMADFDIRNVPGMGGLLALSKLDYSDFHESLVAAHSHLIMISVLTAFSSLAVRLFQYRIFSRGRKRLCEIGLWMALIGLLSAAIIYVLSAIFGWEPPCLFASGSNGMPLDDVVLTLVFTAFLVIAASLYPFSPRGERGLSPRVLSKIRRALSLNWICSFLGAVILGIYIEFHEAFYGAGMAPAPGALNDNIFIRAHMLYPFFLLPVTFAFLLAVGYRHANPAARFHKRTNTFIWLSVIGMPLSLLGECIWVFSRNSHLFLTGLLILVVALLAGAMDLFPGDNIHHQSGVGKGVAR